MVLNQSRDFNFSRLEIFFLFLYSFFNGFYFFVLVMVIRNYTPCHLFLLFQSKEFIINIFYSIQSWNTWKFIMVLITFLLEINASFVFLEMLELRCCGFDQNLRNTIIERGDNEIKILMENITDTTDNNNDE